MLPQKVVIFEDEFLIANDLKQQIQPFNYEVTAMFRKAEEGLKYLADLSNPEDFPDVVLMDILLAGKMTGIEAAEVITQNYNCALVFLTGLSHLETFNEACKTKPRAYLIKPFNINQTIISIKLAVYQNNLEKLAIQHHLELEDRVLSRTRELQLAKDETEETINLKNTMLSNISNQIREPMLGVMGMVTLLKEETRDNPNVQRYVSYIDDNVAHVFSLLRKIMDLKDTR
ncbi:MAG: response regulator [Bacteroidetes bacterium]|nr:response regulator [Bacteroidota bacterium]